MRVNFRITISILGLLISLSGAFMLICLPFALYYHEDWKSIVYSSVIAFTVGIPMWTLFNRGGNRELKKRDGYLIVTLGWLAMSLVGTLPYLISGAIPNFTDAFFETISGFTTTGASILTDIESIDKSILFWRSLTQWIGGMGIIVLAVAILPLLGIGGMQLFGAESPGISPDKLKPRIKDTAKRLWLIYLGLTVVETIMLMFGGMSFFNALNHGLTTMASGGFSTMNDSIAGQNAYIQYVIIIFMFLAGTNFTLIYFGLKGRLRKVWSNEEFRAYFATLVLITIIVVGFVAAASDQPFSKSFRDTLFQVVSLVTTTGYVTANYIAWTPFLTVVFFSLMFLGGSAGSTAGGIKIVRHIILFKNSFLEMKRQLHPSAVIPVRLNGKAVQRDITFHVLAFIMIYFAIFSLGSVVMSLIGLDFQTAMGSVVTSLGNVGPGIGGVGPAENFALIPMPGKWFLSFLMLLGRLELFTVLILFTPYFWRD